MNQFAKSGWSINNITSGHISFFMERSDLGRVCVCIMKDIRSHLMITDAALWAVEQHATVLILTSAPFKVELLKLATQRGIVLLQISSVADFEQSFVSIKQIRRDALIAAKTSDAARPRFASTKSLRQLSREEIDAGFICATDQVACFFDDRGGDLLVVSFSQWESKSDKWGLAYASHGNWSVLGFEAAEPNWFPEDDMLACLRVAQVALGSRFGTRVALGVGQGGYGALQYGKLFDVQLAIATSPIYSIDPVITEDTRFNRFYKPSLHSGMHLTAASLPEKVVVVRDPYDVEDNLHFSRIASIGSMEQLLAPFSGHGCNHVMGAVPEFTNILNFCVQRQFREAQNQITQLRRANTRRPYLMALHLAQKKPKTSLKILLSYGQMADASEWRHVCYRLSERGLVTDVIAWMKGAADRQQTNADVMETVALLAHKMGDTVVAVEYILAALQVRPYDERLHFIHSKITGQI